MATHASQMPKLDTDTCSWPALASMGRPGPDGVSQTGSVCVGGGFGVKVALSLTEAEGRPHSLGGRWRGGSPADISAHY